MYGIDLIVYQSHTLSLKMRFWAIGSPVDSGKCHHKYVNNQQDGFKTHSFKALAKMVWDAGAHISFVV